MKTHKIKSIASTGMLSSSHRNEIVSDTANISIGKYAEMSGKVVRRDETTNMLIGSILPVSIKIMLRSTFVSAGARNNETIKPSPSYASLLDSCELELRDGAFVLQITPKGGFPMKDSPPVPTPPPTRLALCGDDRVIALDAPYKDAQGEFLRNPDGSIAWLRIGGRVHARAE
jgi:hypothetical protein